jgi:hypothetical protein
LPLLSISNLLAVSNLPPTLDPSMFYCNCLLQGMAN